MAVCGVIVGAATADTPATVWVPVPMAVPTDVIVTEFECGGRTPSIWSSSFTSEYRR